VKNQCAEQWQVRFKQGERTAHPKRTDLSGPHLRYEDIDSYGKTSFTHSLPPQVVNVISNVLSVSSFETHSDRCPTKSVRGDMVCTLLIVHMLL
jgi:hypothetical protein